MSTPKFECELSEDNFRMVAEKQTDHRMKGKRYGLGRITDMLLTELRLERLKKKQVLPHY